jgi:hypothetical protein
MDQQKRGALLQARAERQKKLADEDEAHADLVLELDDKYSTELGPRGRAFEIVNEDNSGGEGPIVVKMAEATAHKQYMASPTPTPLEDQFKYVRPSVLYPDGTVFADLGVRRPILVQRCCRALEHLAGLQARIVGKGY